jgi:NADPH:quinone reductase-like Zn-dependent oxidoreductase
MEIPMYHRPPTPRDANASDRSFILIWGGSTITAQFAIQFSKQAGLNVIAVCSERTSHLVQSLGADHVIIRDGKSNELIAEEIRHIGGDDIIHGLDLVGPKTAAAGITALSKNRECSFAPLAMMSQSQAVPDKVKILNVEMKQFVLDESCAVYAQRLNQLVESGMVTLPVIEVVGVGLHTVEDALRRMKEGSMEGKKLVVSWC